LKYFKNRTGKSEISIRQCSVCHLSETIVTEAEQPVVGPPQYVPAPCKLVSWTATQSFKLGGSRACQWCWSLYSICLPSLKFISLPIPKT